MEKRELIDVVESFRYRVKAVACYRKLYQEYCNAYPKYHEAINVCPAFWTFTIRAYLHSMMIDLCKLYDADKKVYGVFHLLDVCKQNISLFAEPKLLDGERYATEAEAREFFQSFDDTVGGTEITNSFLDNLEAECNNRSEKIDNLRLQRNKLWAHNDCKHFLNPSEYEMEKLLTWTDIDDLIGLLVDISNTLLRHLGKGSTGILPANIDDIQIIIEAVKMKENRDGQIENALC